MKFTRLFRYSAMAAIGLIGLGAALAPARAEEPDKAQIEAIRKALAKYEDPYVAVRDLYLSTVACVHYNGDKVEGRMYYPKGAMGIHFVNVPSIGQPLDPMKPNVLIYQPVDGKLKLTSVEWLVPLTPDTKERPKILGQPFQGPMEGHEPLIPKSFVHYDLHAWLFKDNPNGMFIATSPDVSCKGYDFDLLEDPTKMMPGP
ncbi:MAG: hypothetical protein HY245_02325 [Rhizobiales bacterium]|nr:hypothetical protein [Hyphomicrobiales bacterium]MBI3672264.1 hypothetical protein [Hyphomicrobiales bacterium]